jgi:ferric-dicitrate binding protein FerR (iron transport regulator)
MKQNRQKPDCKIDGKLLQCLEGTATKADYRQVSRWAEDPQNRAHYRELLDAAVASHLIQPVKQEEQEKVWENICTEISAREARPSIYRILRKWTAAAAIIAVAILSGIYAAGKYGDSGSLPYTVETVKNGKSVITLNDGSKVWLNKGSLLVCDKEFGRKNRNVELSGEAYFEVAKDAGKPFVVRTEELDVEVIGTRFNVNAAADARTAAVTLAEGKVKVTTAECQQLTLRPGQQLLLERENGKLSVSEVNSELFTSWKNDEIIFEQETLEEILKMMQRSFQINIRLENRQIADRKITGRFPLDEQPDRMLKILQKQVPFNYSSGRDTIFIH